MLILTDGVKTIYGKKITIGTGLNLDESADGLPILHFGDQTGGGVGIGNSKATSPESITLGAAMGMGIRLPSLPVGFTIWESRQGERFDVTAYTQARTVVVVEEAGNEGSGVVVRFGTDGMNFDTVGASQDAVAPINATGTWAGAWVAMRDTCIGDVWFQWGTIGGDGVVSPKIGNVYLQLRNEGTRETVIIPVCDAQLSGLAINADLFETLCSETAVTDFDAMLSPGDQFVYAPGFKLGNFFSDDWDLVASTSARNGVQEIVRKASASTKIVLNAPKTVRDIWFRVFLRNSVIGHSAFVTDFFYGNGQGGIGQGVNADGTTYWYWSFNGTSGSAALAPALTIPANDLWEFIYHGVLGTPTDGEITAAMDLYLRKADGTGTLYHEGTSDTLDDATGSTDWDWVAQIDGALVHVDAWEWADGGDHADPFGVLPAAPDYLFYEDFDYADTAALNAALTGTTDKYSGTDTNVFGGAELDTVVTYDGHATMKLTGTRESFKDSYLLALSKNFSSDVSDVWLKVAVKFDSDFDTGDETGTYDVDLPRMQGAPVSPVLAGNETNDPVVPELGPVIGLQGRSNRYLLVSNVPYEDEFGLAWSTAETGAGAVTSADLRDGGWREFVCRFTVSSPSRLDCSIWVNGATGTPTATQFYDYTTDDGGANESSMSLLRNVALDLHVDYNLSPSNPITPVWVGLVAAYDASVNSDPFGVLGSDVGPDGPVGPSAAINPTAGVVLNPGDNIQSAVNANPAGTAFRLTPGVYSNQSVTPKDGNTFWGEAGAIMDGGGTVQKAFFSTADNVTIKNLLVRNYVPAFSDGAIRGDWNASTGWVMDHLEVTGCFGAGIYMSHSSTVRYCNIHHNGQIGILGWAEDSILEHSEIAYNNTNNNDVNNEAGGLKIFHAANFIARNNYVHHNTGPAIWIDIYNYNVTVEKNLVEDNSHAGIFYEISYAGIIRNNLVRRNGGSASFTRAGIYISSSPDCEVYGNILDDNASGIIGQVANRTRSSDSTLDRGPVITTNLYVHDNTTNLTKGTSGLIDQLGDGAIFTPGANNRFENDTYTVNSIAKPFSGNGGSKTWAEWQGAGYDVTGKLS